MTTASYGSVRRPFVTPLPDLEVATDDDISDLAANALRLDSDLGGLCGSSAHVRRLCQLIETLSLRVDELEDKHAAETAAHKLTTSLYVAELTESNRLRALHADLSERLADMLMPRVTLEIETYTQAELEAEWAAMDRAEHAALERAQARAERVAEAPPRSQRLMFDVTDTVVMDERDIEVAIERRVRTRELQPITMFDTVYGGAA